MHALSDRKKYDNESSRVDFDTVVSSKGEKKYWKLPSSILRVKEIVRSNID